MDQSIKIFKDITGFEGIYRISNFGEILIVKTGNLFNNQKQPNGYLHVVLHKNKKNKHVMVHRLVAQAFLPPPLSGQTDVNHKDENKTNNFVWINPDGSVDIEKSNLEWISHRENMNYGTCQKRKGILHKKPVYKIVNGTKTFYPSIDEAAKEHGVVIQAISNCLRGKTKHAAGAEWKYA